MKLGIMQPYFFPYLGHFSLIASVDRWVVFDTSQYTPRSWMNRNRVLHPSTGWSYVTVPLANGSTSIRSMDAVILDVGATRASVLGKLSHYRRAPYYKVVTALVEEAFATADSSLVRLNVRALRAVCRALELPFEPLVLSEAGLGWAGQPGAGEWALEICCSLGATGYINPVGGRALFDPLTYAGRGIELQFAVTDPVLYQPLDRLFEPNMSVLDALMWLPAGQVADAVRQSVRLIQ